MAAPLLEECIDIADDELGRDHIEVAKTSGNLGVLYMDLEDYGSALTCFMRKLSILESSSAVFVVGRAAAHEDVAEAYSCLAEHENALLYTSYTPRCCKLYIGRAAVNYI